MQVEVNEANIDRYNLVQLTGNSREFLLSQAADAASNGTVLSCRVPDDLVLEQNVFEVYESEHVDPSRLRGCGYERREVEDGGFMAVCVIHGKTSRRDVISDPYAPCLQVDPDTRPSTSEVNEALSSLPKTCVYNPMQHPLDGTVLVCAVHGKRSKYDVSRTPSLPCMAVDPMTAAEGDPHRP